MPSPPPPPAPAAPSSAYEVFGAVDRRVAKPVLGSDGAAAWQSFRRSGPAVAAGASLASSAAPRAPLKKADRLAFADWSDERAHEERTRSEAGVPGLSDAGYTHFRRRRDDGPSAKAAKGVGGAGDEGKTPRQEERRQQERVGASERPDTAPRFVAAPTFQGSKGGYIFTTRDRGTGYYWDGGTDHSELESADRGAEGVVHEEAAERLTEKSEATTAPSTTRKTKRKRPAAGPVIVDDPTNPLEQVAAALLRRRQAGTVASAPSLPEGWEAAADPSTGRTYFFRRDTGERRWDPPPPSNDAMAAGGGGENTAGVQASLPDGWAAAADPATGREYYYHALTGETRWERPDP